MRYFLIYFIFLLSITVKVSAKSKISRPKLVIGIVVDQLRWDYLYRYYDKFSDDGFKKLIDKGFSCQNTLINYVPTFTGPGHACIYTGSVPALHGITANDWIDRKTGRAVYCTEDSAVTPVGGSFGAGHMSPANLLTTTVTDELRMATEMKAKVFGISIKDRGSILPAGHLANGAYWFDDSTGNFMSSSFYSKSLPKWLTKFNNKKYPATYITEDWNLLYAPEFYTQIPADDNKYEGKFPGEKTTAFPHSVAGLKNKGYKGLRYLPAGNTIIFDAGVACIKGEDLGVDNITDFLCLSFSSTDYVGHMFTPNSVEMEDMLLRFDADLAAFLNYLDYAVGKDEYIVFLTADHGAAHNAAYFEDIKIPAGTLAENELKDKLEDILKKEFNVDNLVKMITNYQVHLDRNLIAANRLNIEDIKKTAIEWLQMQDGIALVADLEDIHAAIIPEPVRTRLVNGYYPKRSGDIQIIYEPAWYSDDSKKGTTHGTWNPHDAHIPLIWYGWGIKNGGTFRNVNMTDIAPTLAALLHIQMPNGCIGEVIEAVITGQ